MADRAETLAKQFEAKVQEATTVTAAEKWSVGVVRGLSATVGR